MAASLAPTGATGTWSDSNGNTGVLALGAGISGPPRPGAAQFRVHGNLERLVPSGVMTAVTDWQTVDYNVGGGVFTQSAGSYQVPTAGLYLVTATLGWMAAEVGTGHACLYIQVNGAVGFASTCDGSSSAGIQMPSLTTVLTLNANDAVSASLLQSSGRMRRTAPFTFEGGLSVTRLR